MDQEMIEKLVKRWWQEHIHGSPVARSTEAYNHLKQSMAPLTAALVDALKANEEEDDAAV